MKLLRSVLQSLLICSLMLSTAACSNQYREANANLTDEEITTLVDELFGGIENLKINSNSDILMSVFHSGATEKRPAQSVLSMTDMNVIDKNWEPGIWSKDTNLNDAQVMFVENINEAGEHYYKLGIRMSYADSEQPTYFTAQSESASDVIFTDDGFQVYMLTSTGDTLIVESDDISEDYENELGDSVKLNLYIVDETGEYYAGQISTMARYYLE